VVGAVPALTMRMNPVQPSDARRSWAVAAWLFLFWSLFLYWRYLTTVPEAQSLVEIGAHASTLAMAAVFCGFPAGVLWLVERRYSRAAARVILVSLLIGVSAVIVFLAGVIAGALAALALLVSAYGFGGALMAKLHMEDTTWRGAPLAIALGLIVIVTLGVIAGLLRLLILSVVTGIVVVGVGLACLRALRKIGHMSSPRCQTAPECLLAWWWVWGVLILTGLVGAVAPEVRHDALASHLPIAREFVLNHAIVEMRQQIQSYFPLNAHILYVFAMILHFDASAPKLLHWAAGVVASLLTYVLGVRLWSSRVGLTAAIIFAGTPLVWWVGGTAYTDLWTVLFLVAAVVALSWQIETGRTLYAVTVGLFAGAALGTKLTSLVLIGPLTLAVVWAAGTSRGNSADRLQVLGLVALALALASAVWFTRSWILSGNPVLPFLNGLFKSPYFAAENTRLNMAQFGMGTGVVDFLLLPWRVTLLPQRFVEIGNIGIAYLGTLPLAVWAIATRRVPFWFWGITTAALLLWFSSAQYLRYLLPLMPLIALMGSAGIVSLPASGRLPRLAEAAVLAGALAGFGAWVTSGPPNFPIEVLGGVEGRDRFTAWHVDGYRVAQYARTSLPRGARIYGAGEDFPFYYDRFFVPISWYGRPFSPTLPDAFLRTKTGREAEELLVQAGFTHLVVRTDNQIITTWRRPDGWLAREAFWEGGPWLEYAYREHYLFRLDPARQNVVRRRGPELLRNPQLGPVPGREVSPNGWVFHGRVVLVPAITSSGAAAIAARVSAGGYLAQTVPVTPTMLHVLEVEVRATRPKATARLFIQWFDEKGHVVDYTTWRRVTLSSQWRRYAMACTSPPQARSAMVWLISEQGGDTEFSNPHFYELR
jgi:hypothetical protein